MKHYIRKAHLVLDLLKKRPQYKEAVKAIFVSNVDKKSDLLMQELRMEWLPFGSNRNCAWGVSGRRKASVEPVLPYPHSAPL